MKRLDECERIEFCWVLCEWSRFVTFKTCGATPRTPFSHWTCDSCSESGACATQRCSPPAVPFPPQPPQQLRCLVRSVHWYYGTVDFSSACMSALRLSTFADRPSQTNEGALEISRFSCMLFSWRLRVLRLRRTGQPLACIAAALLPSSSGYRVGILTLCPNLVHERIMPSSLNSDTAEL
jgi:hypothetical protein